VVQNSEKHKQQEFLANKTQDFNHIINVSCFLLTAEIWDIPIKQSVNMCILELVNKQNCKTQLPYNISTKKCHVLEDTFVS
jgi:hypothetical protein